MTNPTWSQAIKTILDKRAQPDLAALYHPGMEVQANVARDGGQKVGGFRSKSFTDGVNIWYSFRIPKNAMSEPEDNSEQEMSYPFGEHVEGIGMTGWDFRERTSRWFAYDFDAIVGHSERHAKKMSDEELELVKKAALEIPWVTVRRSASGSGLHLYVFLDPPVPTKDHNEHAALARAVIAHMSAKVGFDFDTKVDVCGGNMWVWHRKSKGNNGLTLVKQGSPLPDVPKDWRSHVKVVRGERKKSLPTFIEEQGDEDLERLFDELAGERPRIKLDDEHKKLISWLEENQGYGWWDADHHMLVTHTYHLKRAHQALNFRGVFETSTDATQTDEQNAFMFPTRRGAWVVHRYTMGCAEAPTWEQDGRGYTKCHFNRDPDLRSAAKAGGGIEVENGGFNFREAGMAVEVAKILGAEVDVPAWMANRPAKIKAHKDGKRIIIETDAQAHDNPKDLAGWYNEKNKWKKVVSAPFASVDTSADVGVVDDAIRHCVSEAKCDAGWFVKVDKHWHQEPKSNIGSVLASFGKKKPEIEALLGASVVRPWFLVSRPFQDEYPGDRLWNRSRAQYKYPRSDEVGEHVHWDKVFEHCGRGLDDALSMNGWALANEITKGSDYLKLWYAALLQFPYSPLPYLFFHGHEKAGKSIFHEMFDFLVTSGRVIVNDVFEDKERFNGQMEGAVLTVIEEMNVRKNRAALERIKNWVTAPYISIHKKMLTPYQLPNTTHWVHTANDHQAAPIFPGDTRITMIAVPDLTPEEMIPRAEMDEHLRREAPHFLNYLLSIEIPQSNDRLRIPVIETSEKAAVAGSNMTSLEEFMKIHVHQVPGMMIAFSEFYEKFHQWLDPYEQSDWTKPKVSKLLPPEFPVGNRGGVSHIGNINWAPRKSDEPIQPRLVLEGRLLRPAKNGTVTQ